MLWYIMIARERYRLVAVLDFIVLYIISLATADIPTYFPKLYPYFILFVMDGVFILLLISDWEDFKAL